MFDYGNWLLPDQAITVLEAPDPKTMKDKRDIALFWPYSLHAVCDGTRPLS